MRRRDTKLNNLCTIGRDNQTTITHQKYSFLPCSKKKLQAAIALGAPPGLSKTTLEAPPGLQSKPVLGKLPPGMKMPSLKAEEKGEDGREGDEK